MTKLLKLFACLLALQGALCAQEGPDTALAQAVNNLLHGNDFRGIAQYKMPKFTVVVGPSEEVNAYANPATHVISVSRSLIRIMSDGELVFVIAHEIGHIQDADCPQRGAAHRLSGLALRRMCEAAADEIGMQYLIAAGYSPFEGAGVMGKLLMANPGEGTILGIAIGRFLSDHPVYVDRIRQLTIDARSACQHRPEICP